MRFADRNFLVTGGFGGIGSSLCRALLEEGARVFVGHRGASPVPSDPDLGSRAHPVELDVTREEDWERVVQSILTEHGALYGLVNNAARLEPGTPFMDVSLAQWRRQMDVNLDGTFLGCRFGLRAMAPAGGGVIVNVSTAAARLGVPDAAAYCVSKAAVLTLTRLAAKAGGPLGVRVSAVLPGAIDTPMLWRNLREGQAPEELRAALERMHPIGRIGVPVDVVNAVLFLCDPANDFITGAELAVDGGQIVG